MKIAVAIALVASTAVSAQQAAPLDFVELIGKTENGLVSAAESDLPPSYLRRIADRSLRLSFRQALRAVAPPTATIEDAPPASARELPPGITVAPSPSRALADAWSGYDAGVPQLRGFRAPLLDEEPSPTTPPRISGSPHVEAATFVARNLARDGLVRTTLRVLLAYELPWVDGARLDPETLRSVGLPADLLDRFRIGDEPAGAALASWLSAGAAEGRIDSIVEAARFRFEPSLRGFRVMTEDGGERPGGLRMQLATPRPTMAELDGSAPDVLRQLAALPLADRIVISIDESLLPQLLGRMREFDIAEGVTLDVVPTPLPVTRWAQDNGKSGRVLDADGTARVVTLLPRYASINEQTSKFQPGDSLVAQTLRERGLQFAQSPLLFQGGDLLPVADPRSGARLLLMGEGELYRNRTLGLSPAEVVEAFRIEFGVDRVVVLPAISYHLDLEVAVRRTPSGLVAVVNDELAAARIIVREGLRALARHGTFAAEQQQLLDRAVEHENALPLVTTLWQLLNPLRDADKRFGPRVTSAFSTSPAESGPANALRFFLAVDLLTAHALTQQQLSDGSTPRQLRVYMASIRRRTEQRAELQRTLRDLGLTVHAIPSLSDEESSINYVNGVHSGKFYAMPAYGGLYAPLDDAAAGALHRAFGEDVRIEPIRSAMVQARYGGLHCLVGLLPGQKR
ncbi:MAG: hypothetical protein GY716_07630 [bacterium]|nr:hypothetical protein [bacterium]